MDDFNGCKCTNKILFPANPLQNLPISGKSQIKYGGRLLKIFIFA